MRLTDLAKCSCSRLRKCYRDCATGPQCSSMNSDGAASRNDCAEGASSYHETVIVNKRVLKAWSRVQRRQINYLVPVQVPEELVPLITSQYDPAGNEVVNVVLHAESSLFIATNPAEPVLQI